MEGPLLQHHIDNIVAQQPTEQSIDFLFHMSMHDRISMVWACGCSMPFTLWRHTSFMACWALSESCLLRPQMAIHRLYVSMVHIMSPWISSRKCCHMRLLARKWGSSILFCSYIVSVCCQSSRMKGLGVSASSFHSSSNLSNKIRSSRKKLWVKLTHPRAFNSAGRQLKVTFHYFKRSAVVWRLPLPTLQPSNRTFISSDGRNITSEWILLTSLS